MPTLTKIYLAAALARSSFVETIAAALRPTFDVVSGWHRRSAGVLRDTRDEDERTAICALNLSELVQADVVVVMVEDDRYEPKATYGELGYALALCKPCVVVHHSGTGRCILDSHPLVVRLDLLTMSHEDLPRTIDIAASLVQVPREDRITLPAPAPEDDESARLVGFERGANGG